MTPEEPTPDEKDRLDEEAFWRKLRSVPRGVVERALMLYVLLTDGDTPAWVRGLVLAALAYLINPLDACPDVLPGIGLTDDLAVLALALERLSHYVTPEVEARAKRLVPRWLAGGEKPTNEKKGEHDNAEEEEGNEGRGRFHILN